MKRKYNKLLGGVFAWFGNKYNFDPTFPRLLFIVSCLLPQMFIINFCIYMMADLFVVDESLYDDEK